MKQFYHKLDGFQEVLVKVVVVEIVLWVICAVHHTTGAAGYRSKLLLSCILKGTREGTYVKVYRQVGEILTRCILQIALLIFLSIFCFSITQNMIFCQNKQGANIQ